MVLPKNKLLKILPWSPNCQVSGCYEKKAKYKRLFRECGKRYYAWVCGEHYLLNADQFQHEGDTEFSKNMLRIGLKMCIDRIMKPLSTRLGRGEGKIVFRRISTLCS